MALFLLSLLCVPAVHAGDGAGSPIELVADGLFAPTDLASPPDGQQRIYVPEQWEGLIRVIDQGRLLPQAFLDLHDRIIAAPKYEEGLLSLAFSPHFPVFPYLYVTYINLAGKLVLSRFEVMPSGLEAIASSEQVLLEIRRDERIHHCGHIEFGPRDGLLYLCVGDTQDNLTINPAAQDPERPLGKILRMAVENVPVAGLQPIAATTTPTAYEVWATGLRNPWRFTFDPATGDMFIPDVGRHHWEELDVLSAADQPGANFGWPLAEGNECIAQCDRPDLVWPIYEYPHDDDRCAIIGGVVYRGSEFPDWQGAYIFGDGCSGEIWALRDPAGAPEIRKLAGTDMMPASFGIRFDGEILVADARNGAVWRLLLPDIDDDEWISVDRAMFAMIMKARRTRVGWAQEELDRIYTSQLWRWSRPFSAMYRYIRGL